MKHCLPYGVKNKLKWKNGFYIKKSVKEVENRLNKQINESKNFNEIISTILFPKVIYAFFDKHHIIIQIFISETNKVTFADVGNDEYEIMEIINEEDVLEKHIGFNKSIFYNNVFL